MRINNNLMAMNTHRMLGINTTAGAASVEKLSSGYRINRAGDDAAGLAISEKMRSQIRGLSQASRNALDDISLIQTAEGALNETHAIIHRMREIAVQSSNDSNTDPDREALQNEMNQLAQEVTRIANDTEFNTRKLLNGNLDQSVPNAVGDLTFHIGANTNQNMKFSVKAMDAFTLGLAVNGGKVIGGQPDITGVKVTPNAADRGKAVADGVEVVITSAQTSAPTPATAATVAMNGDTVNTTNLSGLTDGTIKVTVDSRVFTITTQQIKDGLNGGTTSSYTANDMAALINNAVGQDVASVAGAKLSLTSTSVGATSNVKIEFAGTTDTNTLQTAFGHNAATADANGTAYAAGEYTVTAFARIGATTFTEDVSNVKGDASSVVFADADKFKGLSIITDGLFEGLTGSVKLGLSNAAKFQASGGVEIAKAGIAIDITTQKAANVAIDRIDLALKRVSDQRAELGAVQNRLNHTIKNVDTAAENLQASESRIRDVDMAKEMMTYTKNNILQQAAQAMLAQANQAPQGVLQLLR